MLTTGERHLRLILSQYIDHDNGHRPHRSLQQSPPGGRPHPAAAMTGMRIQRRDRLGGPIYEYAQAAQGDTVSGTHRRRLVFVTLIA